MTTDQIVSHQERLVGAREKRVIVPKNILGKRPYWKFWDDKETHASLATEM